MRERGRESGEENGRWKESERGRVRGRDNNDVHLQEDMLVRSFKTERRWNSRNGGHNQQRWFKERWRANHEEDSNSITNQGEWVEVIHRRKRKLAENRGIAETSRHQWQDRKVTWKRGLLKRVGICHDIGGNTYVFLSL